MEDPRDLLMEKILKQIEFPGENEEQLSAYLEKHQFVDRVMELTADLNSGKQKIVLWAVLVLVNLGLLFVAGINDFIVQDFFALQDALSQFFFLFLGISLLGSLLGLVFSIDSSWVDHLMHRES